MKVYIQIIDKTTGIYQTGMIEEPVIKGKEVENALLHFGIQYALVNWYPVFGRKDSPLYGELTDTTKVISVITI